MEFLGAQPLPVVGGHEHKQVAKHVVELLLEHEIFSQVDEEGERQ